MAAGHVAVFAVSHRMAFLLAVAVAALGSTAAADGFGWRAPADCPTAATVRARIDRRLDAGTEVGTIDVSVTRVPTGGFRAVIDTRAISVAGQGRTLSAARCDALADAVAVIVARLASDAHRTAVAKRGSTQHADAASSRRDDVSRTGGPARSGGDQHDAEMPDVMLAVRIPTATRPERVAAKTAEANVVDEPHAWTGGIRLLALTGIGITPKVGYGGELSGFVHRHDAFAELGYARWAERPTYVLPNTLSRFDVGVSLLTLRGGWSSSHMPLRGWLGVEVGSMHGTGAPLMDPHADSGRWTAISGGFGVGWPMSPRTRLVGTFELAAPVERARFTLANGTEIYQPAPASARAAFGLEVGWR